MSYHYSEQNHIVIDTLIVAHAYSKNCFEEKNEAQAWINKSWGGNKCKTEPN